MYPIIFLILTDDSTLLSQQRASTYDISAERNVWLQSALRSSAIIWKQVSLRSSAICDRLRSYGNQPLVLRIFNRNMLKCLQGKKHFKSSVNRNVWEFKLATGVVSSGLFYDSILTHRGKFNSWLYGHSLTAVFRVDKLFSAVKVPPGSGAHVGCDIRTNALPYSVIFSESWLTITGIRSPVIPACSWSTSVWCLLTFVYVFSNTGKDKKRRD